MFGKAVQLAARLCAHAEPAQILVAKVVFDQCEGEKLSFLDLGEVTLKGFDQPIHVYDLNWAEV